MEEKLGLRSKKGEKMKLVPVGDLFPWSWNGKPKINEVYIADLLNHYQPQRMYVHEVGGGEMVPEKNDRTENQNK